MDNKRSNPFDLGHVERVEQEEAAPAAKKNKRTASATDMEAAAVAVIE